MNQADWAKIEEIFYAAMELATEDQASFLEKACAGDSKLQNEVQSLLEKVDTEDSFLGKPNLSLGLTILGTEKQKSLIGEKIGRYQIVKLLGEGGMGSVFLAEDLPLNRLVAIKLLPEYLLEDDESVARFQKEALAASAITHPNIAHIYEAGIENNRRFIAMEYVEGKTLRELIKEKNLDVATALDIVLQTAYALAAAHQAGIIHRDIKPENIMIRQDGYVKVLDFGIAKLLQDREKAKRDDKLPSSTYSPENTNPGLIMGTIGYISPEQLNHKNVDFRADIWGLGVVLYEVLTGQKPFRGNTKEEIGEAIIRNDFVSFNVPKIGLKENAHLSEIITKSLHKIPAQRFASALDFASELKLLKQQIEFNEQINSGGISLSFTQTSNGAATVEQKQNTSLIIGSKTFWNRHYQPGKTFFLAALVLFLTLASGFYFFSAFRNSTNQTAKFESLAVLPLLNETGNTENEFLVDGLTESLIIRLSEIPGLRVKSRNTVFQFKNINFDSKKDGQKLDVDTILKGRLAAEGDGLRINVELIEVATGNLLWAESFRQNRENLNGFISKIARAVSLRIGQTSNLRLEKVETKDPKAEELYLRGRFHWNKRTVKDFEKAINYYEQALALDDKFARAYCGLAETYTLMSGYGGGTPADTFPRAKQAALKALELDNELAEAHTVLSYIYFNYDWNFSQSEASIKKAIELNPNYSIAYHWYGNANLLSAGRFEESISCLKKAVELDPLSLIINADLGNSYLYSGYYDQAAAQYRKTLELDENFSYAQTYLGRTYLMQGKYKEALNTLEKAQLLNANARNLMLMACVYVAEGNRRKALQTLEQMDKMGKETYVSPYFYAIVYVALNERDKAFEWLEKAYQVREGRMTFLKVDPLLAPLRDDPRFAVLSKQIGFE